MKCVAVIYVAYLIILYDKYIHISDIGMCTLYVSLYVFSMIILMYRILTVRAIALIAGDLQ